MHIVRQKVLHYYTDAISTSVQASGSTFWLEPTFRATVYKRALLQDTGTVAGPWTEAAVWLQEYFYLLILVQGGGGQQRACVAGRTPSADCQNSSPRVRIRENHVTFSSHFVNERATFTELLVQIEVYSFQFAIKKSFLVSQYPNIIANVRHAWLDEGAVRVMRKKMKVSSDGSDSGRNTCKRGYDGAYGGV
jgi:hypothetical protein